MVNLEIRLFLTDLVAREGRLEMAGEEFGAAVAILPIGLGGQWRRAELFFLRT